MALTAENYIKEKHSLLYFSVTEHLPLVFLATIGIILLRLNWSKHSLVTRFPVGGKKWQCEPSLVTRYRFVYGGWETVIDGWNKFRNVPFTVLRPDSNVTVLPQRYVRELQNLPDTILNPIRALSEDIVGDYTGMNILVGSHLSFNVIRNKLTPKLGDLIAPIEEETCYGMSTEIPTCKDSWVEVNLNQVVTRLVSRITSRTWVGLSICRDDSWHSANIATTSNIFITALTLRNFPAFLHPMLALLLPSRWRLRKGLRKIHSYLVPLINERRLMEREDPLYTKPDDVIQWMMDLAEGEERRSENLATRYVFSVIGSLYTVSAGVVDCIYDLTERPDDQAILRAEARKVLEEDQGWKKGTPAKLEKLDSFMKESQRVNAPSPISFKRITQKTITLSDGLELPKGCYICVINASYMHSEDRNDNADLKRFDGLRYYRKRQNPGLKSRHQYSSTDKSHITFGHGRFSCPGRFVASVEMKMILVHFLLNYDMSFPAGKTSRPKNLQVLELGFQDPDARFLLRSRAPC